MNYFLTCYHSTNPIPWRTHERMDYAIQNAGEDVDVYENQPLFSERCEVKLQDSRLKKRRQHCQAVTIRAARQYGRSIVPLIKEPINLFD